MNTENNKLISEFLGDKIELRDYGSALPGKKAFYYICKNVLVFLCMDNGTDNAYHEVWMREAAKLNFHKDWNALMEVVEKIEIENDIYSNQPMWDSREEFKGWTCTWFTLMPKYEILGHLDTLRFPTKIESVYNSVVEFIAWYNKRPKK